MFVVLGADVLDIHLQGRGDEDAERALEDLRKRGSGGADGHGKVVDTFFGACGDNPCQSRSCHPAHTPSFLFIL